MFPATPQKTSLPGRDEECAEIAALVSGIAGGSGGALAFHGDVGMGKTALIRFAIGEAAGFAVVAVAGDEAEAGVPFAALHHLLHLLAEHLPEPLSEQAVRLAEAMEAGARTGDLALAAQVQRLLREAARERPLLCTVDDMQWLDRPSSDVLAFVARRVRSERIGLVFAWCGETRFGTTTSGIPIHRLAPLGPRVSREVLAAAVPSPDVRAVLAESAKGNPRALMDLAMSLTTAGLDGLRLANESGQHNLAGNYLAMLAAFAAMTGDRDTCLLRLKEAGAHHSGHGVNRATAIGDWAMAALALADGRYADVVAHLRRIIGGGHLIVQVGATPHLVEAALRCGRRAAAVDALKVYDSWAASTRSPHWLALSARCHALLLGNADEAEPHFREALAQHSLSTAEFDLARTGLLYGQYLRRRRKPKAAQEFLNSALSTFERFDARPWAERAAGELRATGHVVRPRGVRATDTLTPHQAQIAGLVADGATNREVAARMLISTRTVDHHMRNIFAKLGVRSRVELAKLMH